VGVVIMKLIAAMTFSVSYQINVLVESNCLMSKYSCN